MEDCMGFNSKMRGLSHQLAPKQGFVFGSLWFIVISQEPPTQSRIPVVNPLLSPPQPFLWVPASLSSPFCSHTTVPGLRSIDDSSPTPGVALGSESNTDASKRHTFSQSSQLGGGGKTGKMSFQGGRVGTNKAARYETLGSGRYCGHLERARWICRFTCANVWVLKHLGQSSVHWIQHRACQFVTGGRARSWSMNGPEYTSTFLSFSLEQ